MQDEVFESESKGIRASGYKKQDNKFVVLKGSFAVDDSELKDSFFDESRTYVEDRQILIATKKLEKKAHSYQFTEDVEFNSPSKAASIIWGCNLNGKKSFGIGENIDKNHNFYFEIDNTKAIEGYELDKQLNINFRDKNIVQKRKEKDNFTCQVCSYKMKIDGKHIIECHHLYPISLGTRETSIDDLASLCPTCHRIVHLRQPIYSLAEVKSLIGMRF
jgi:5-methylcytosine-specific restriction endonuclease McrA